MEVTNEMQECAFSVLYLSARIFVSLVFAILCLVAEVNKVDPKESHFIGFRTFCKKNEK